MLGCLAVGLVSGDIPRRPGDHFGLGWIPISATPAVVSPRRLGTPVRMSCAGTFRRESRRASRRGADVPVSSTTGVTTTSQSDLRGRPCRRRWPQHRNTRRWLAMCPWFWLRWDPRAGRTRRCGISCSRGGKHIARSRDDRDPRSRLRWRSTLPTRKRYRFR